MECLKKLNGDMLYKVKLKLINGCDEYCLVNANDSDIVYIVFEDSDIDKYIV